MVYLFSCKHETIANKIMGILESVTQNMDKVNFECRYNQRENRYTVTVEGLPEEDFKYYQGIARGVYESCYLD